MSIFLYFRSIIFYNCQKKITEIKKILGVNYVNFEEIDPLFIKIMIICEDCKFYSHSGFYSNKRRFIINLFKQIIFRKRLIFSGIYQQLIKNLFFEKSNSNFYNGYRKIIEYLMTPIFNNIYSKNMILEYYFNILLFIDYKSKKVKFFGIKNISKNIFNKELEELNIFDYFLISTCNVNPIYYYPLIKQKKITINIYDKIKKLKNIFSEEKKYLEIINLEINKYQIID